MGMTAKNIGHFLYDLFVSRTVWSHQFLYVKKLKENLEYRSRREELFLNSGSMSAITELKLHSHLDFFPSRVCFF